MSSAKSGYSGFFSRVRDARRAAGLTQGELAGEIGCSQDTISDIERGKSKGSDALRRALAAALNVAEEWLRDGTGAMRVAEYSSVYGRDIGPGVAYDIPLLGKGSAGKGVFNVDGFPVGHGLRRIRRPYDVADPHAFAVTVDGDSMAPRYEDKEIVVCSPAKSWNRSGDYCVVVTNDDNCLIKRVREQDGQLILTSLNAAYETVAISKSTVRAVFKIVWKKER